MEGIKTDIKTLKSFGLTLAIAFMLLSGLLFFRHKHAAAIYTLVFSLLFIIIRLVLPVALKQVYIIWMRLAFALAWINTRIILTILFYLVFSPLGFLMRLWGADLLDRRVKDKTYWKKKENTGCGNLDYERRF